MKLPSNCKRIEIYYTDDLYIMSPSYPDDKPNIWTIWDSSKVRQGARIVESGLTFRQAEKRIRELSQIKLDSDSFMVNIDGRSLGEVIRDARIQADRHFTLRDIAKRLDVAPSYLSDIENNRIVPSKEVLGRLAKEFKLKLDEWVVRSAALELSV